MARLEPRTYRRALACAYAGAALLHAIHLLGVPLGPWLTEPSWRVWVVALMVAEVAAAVGLWIGHRWGTAAFLAVASAQLLVNLSRVAFYGAGTQLFALGQVAFHLLAVLGFIAVRRAENRPTSRGA